MDSEEIRRMLMNELFRRENVSDWWNTLPFKVKTKLCDILGIDGKNKKRMYDKLDVSVQSEIDSYYRKHKGKVEGK